MAQGIDFLKGKRKSFVDREKLFRSIKVGTIVFLVAYCIVVSAIVSYSLYRRQTNKGLQENIALKTKRLTELKKTESLHLLLKQRLSSLTKILAPKSQLYAAVIDYVDAVSPASVTVKNIEISSDGAVMLSGLAANSKAVDEFLVNIDNEEAKRNFFKKVTLQPVTRQEDGSYTFGLTLQINEKS